MVDNVFSWSTRGLPRPVIICFTFHVRTVLSRKPFILPLVAALKSKALNHLGKLILEDLKELPDPQVEMLKLHLVRDLRSPTSKILGRPLEVTISYTMLSSEPLVRHFCNAAAGIVDRWQMRIGSCRIIISDTKYNKVQQSTTFCRTGQERRATLKRNPNCRVADAWLLITSGFAGWWLGAFYRYSTI